MGATHVTVAVCNPADPSKRWEGLFLVDTGATDCYVPAKQLDSQIDLGAVTLDLRGGPARRNCRSGGENAGIFGAGQVRVRPRADRVHG